MRGTLRSMRYKCTSSHETATDLERRRSKGTAQEQRQGGQREALHEVGSEDAHENHAGTGERRGRTRHKGRTQTLEGWGARAEALLQASEERRREGGASSLKRAKGTKRGRTKGRQREERVNKTQRKEKREEEERRREDLKGRGGSEDEDTNERSEGQRDERAQTTPGERQSRRDRMRTQEEEKGERRGRGRRGGARRVKRNRSGLEWVGVG